MRSYSELTSIFPPLTIEAYRAAEVIVEALPNSNKGGTELLRCHEVARLVYNTLRPMPMFEDLGMVIIDGKYGPMPHSWMMLRMEGVTSVLDVYAVGRLPMVQLVTPSFGYAALYEPGPERDDIRWNDVGYAQGMMLQKLIA